MTGRGVLLETDAYSTLFIARPDTRDHRTRSGAWASALRGERVVIAFQTRAEVLVGARQSGWGATRTEGLLNELARTPTVPLDEQVLDAFVDLSVACRRLGHGLHAKVHTADRWIAACAIAHRLPLLTGDGVFSGAPGLELAV